MTKARDISVLIMALAALWQGLHWLAGDVALTAPGPTLAYAAQLLTSPRFWPNIAETGRALGLALLISSIGGLGLGILLGGHRLSGAVMEPVLVALYALPKITLYPLILLIFGLGLPAKVAFGAIHGVIPVTIFAMNAIRSINPVHLRTAQALTLTPWQTATTILLPAALPEIVTGLRVGFCLTLLGVLIGEMFASQRGLGFLLINAIGLNDVRMIMAVTLMLASFSILVNGLLLALDRRLHRRI